MVKKSFLLGLALVGFVTAAQAQTCPPRYAAVDRNYVKNLFAGTVEPTLARMKELSYLGSLPMPLVQLGLLTQRAAMENEFQAEVAYLSQLGQNPPMTLKRRTKAFLAAVLNASNLGITGLSLTAATEAQAEVNSSVANTAVTAAMPVVWNCF